jgi:hypothetical protein
VIPSNEESNVNSMMIGRDVWTYLVEIWTIESDNYPLFVFVLYSRLCQYAR